MKSLLAQATKADVIADPFPHIALKGALGDDTCLQLLEEFPSLEELNYGEPYGSNKRLGLPARDTLENPGICPAWREFVAYHTSAAFMHELLGLFEDHIRRIYPQLEDELGPMSEWRVGTREIASFEDTDFQLDCQISANSPVVSTPDSVRAGHLDAPTKLFAGLFYMRHPDDRGEGGNLELSRFKRAPRGLRGPAVYETFSEVCETVAYERDTLVIFLNSIGSIHGVTVRQLNPVPRYFVNLVGAVEKPLFDMSPYQATTVDKLVASREILGRKLARA